MVNGKNIGFVVLAIFGTQSLRAMEEEMPPLEAVPVVQGVEPNSVRDNCAELGKILLLGTSSAGKSNALHARPDLRKPMPRRPSVPGVVSGYGMNEREESVLAAATRDYTHLSSNSEVAQQRKQSGDEYMRRFLKNAQVQLARGYGAENVNAGMPARSRERTTRSSSRSRSRSGSDSRSRSRSDHSAKQNRTQGKLNSQIGVLHVANWSPGALIRLESKSKN